MDQLFGSLDRLEAHLADADVEWAVIGGLAVAVWGEPRLTRDVDAVRGWLRDFELALDDSTLVETFEKL